MNSFASGDRSDPELELETEERLGGLHGVTGPCAVMLEQRCEELVVVCPPTVVEGRYVIIGALLV